MDQNNNQPVEEVRVQYASTGSRFLALFIDVLIIAIVNEIFDTILALGLGKDNLTYLLFSSLIPIVTWIGYNIYFLTSTGSTLGKNLLNIRVVKDGSLRLLTTEEVIIRSFLYILNWFFLIDILVAFFNSKTQTIHDISVKSIVIKK